MKPIDLPARVAAALDGATAESLSSGKDDLVECARRNVVTIRLADRLGSKAPAALAEAAAAERRRIAEATTVIERLAHTFKRAGRRVTFVKAFQHLPDMGHDIDVLVDASPGESASLLASFATPDTSKESAVHRFAGKRSYRVGAVDVELHHRRVGQLGEHRRLAGILLEHAVETPLPTGKSAAAPRSEHQLVLAAVQRMYGHFSIRVADWLCAMRLLRTRLDWDEVARTSREVSVNAGMTRYLQYVAGICASAGVPSPMSPRVEPRVPTMSGGVWVVPRVTVVAPLYGRRFAARVASGDWFEAGRMAAAPAFAARIAIVRPAARDRV